MVKRQTIALLAAEEQVPLVLTARQQALVDAVATQPVFPWHAHREASCDNFQYPSYTPLIINLLF